MDSDEAVTADARAALATAFAHGRELDGDRAAGVFGVLATGFAVLLGFIVFLSFTSYDQSRTGAETEARMVVQQVETAQFFREATAAEPIGDLVCYGRSVVHQEWERMRSDTPCDAVNPCGIELFRTLQTLEPETASQQSAYDKFLEQTSIREEGRQNRVHGAEGVIPTVLWIILFFIATIIFVFTLFFADSAERAVVQSLLMGAVVSVIVALLLLLQALDNPFHAGVGGSTRLPWRERCDSWTGYWSPAVRC